MYISLTVKRKQKMGRPQMIFYPRQCDDCRRHYVSRQTFSKHKQRCCMAVEYNKPLRLLEDVLLQPKSHNDIAAIALYKKIFEKEGINNRDALLQKIIQHEMTFDELWSQKEGRHHVSEVIKDINNLLGLIPITLKTFRKGDEIIGEYQLHMNKERLLLLIAELLWQQYFLPSVYHNTLSSVISRTVRISAWKWGIDVRSGNDGIDNWTEAKMDPFFRSSIQRICALVCNAITYCDGLNPTIAGKLKDHAVSMQQQPEMRVPEAPDPYENLCVPVSLLKRLETYLREDCQNEYIQGWKYISDALKPTSNVLVTI